MSNLLQVGKNIGKLIVYLLLVFLDLILVINLLNQLINSEIDYPFAILAIIASVLLVLVAFPEIKKFNFFGFGFEKEEPKIIEENKTKDNETEENILLEEVKKYFP